MAVLGQEAWPVEGHPGSRGWRSFLTTEQAGDQFPCGASKPPQEKSIRKAGKKSPRSPPNSQPTQEAPNGHDNTLTGARPPSLRGSRPGARACPADCALTGTRPRPRAEVSEGRGPARGH